MLNGLKIWSNHWVLNGVFLFTLVLFSCEFHDTNIDPTRPLDAELKEILPAAITQTAHNYLTIGGRVTGTIVQHFTGLDAQPASYSQYVIDERTLDVFWRTGLYGGAMKDCDVIIQKANDEENYHYRGIAKILMAVNVGMATTFWGDIPYQEAFKGSNQLRPAYDEQEQIYGSIQRLLSEAIRDLHQLPTSNAPADDDLIFHGDVDKWIMTAHALQARYALHLTKRNENAAEKALDHIASGAFTSELDEPNFRYGSQINEAHPLPSYSFERPDQLALSNYLFDLLRETNDIRLDRMAIMKDGIPIIYFPDSLQIYWGQFDTPQPLISMTELKFIEAEAHLILGAESEAEKLFYDAVVAHMNQLHIPQKDYLPFVTANIHFNNCSSIQEKLVWLLTQKHIALYGQDPLQAWVDYRRTGFPDLRPPNGVNTSFNPSKVIPRRYLYPISERNTNFSNWEKSIKRQGGHLMDVDMWVFK